MDIATFKDAAENLGRFASIRDKAPDPADKIVVQARDGVLKLVGGNAHSTLVVNCGPTKAKGIAVVSARLLLNAAKVLRGKGTVEFTVSPEGAAMRTSGDREAVLPNVATVLPGLILPLDPETAYSITVPKGFWPDSCKVLTLGKPVGGWDQVAFEVKDVIGTMLATFIGGDNHIASFAMLRADGHQPAAGSLRPEFVASLRGFEEAGVLYWTETAFMVESGPYRATTHFQPGWPKVPTLPSAGEDHQFTVSRSQLIDAVKGIGIYDDEYHRLVLSISSGTLRLRSWGGQESMTLPCDAFENGHAKVGVAGDILNEALRAVGGKSVRLSWGESGPLSVEGELEWPVLLARVQLWN